QSAVLHGSFKNFDSAQNVVGGLFPGIAAVELTSVPCSLTGPPTPINLDDCSLAAPMDVTDSGIAWTRPKGGTMTLAQLTTLSAAYNVGATDCGGGSPRFVIQLSGGAFLSGYFGPAPDFSGCPAGWQNTGNVANPADTTARWVVGESSHSYQSFAAAS